MVEPKLTEEWPPQKGEFIKRGDDWYHGCITCGAVSSLADHLFTPNTMTVRPSIVCKVCEAHYFVDSGSMWEVKDGSPSNP